jgi:hypothetical protein
MMIPLQENPTLAIRLGPMAESRLYKIAHPAIFCDLSFVCLIQTGHTTGPRHYRIRSARNFSTRHCSLRPTPHITKYWQAAACPRAAQKSATYRSLRFIQWQPLVPSAGAIALQIKSCIGCVCHKHPPPPTSARCLWRATPHRKATAMHVPSILKGSGCPRHSIRPPYRGPQ